VLAQFGQQAISVVPLQRPSDERIVCRIAFEDDVVGVLRLIKNPAARDWLGDTADILRSLERSGYPAPRVLAASNGLPAWVHDGWSGLMTTFVAGNVIASEPDKLRQVASMIAWLHSSPALSPLRPSRFDLPASTAATRSVLMRLAPPQPAAIASMVAQLLPSLDRLAILNLLNGMVHGDAWYMNAIETPKGAVVMIDWDQCGLGALVGDLAYLLLTSHYDLLRPLDVQPDQAKVRAIVEGYYAVRPITSNERNALLDLMRFALAYFLRQVIESGGDLSPDGMVFCKLQARLAATQGIADLAAQMA
jgi:Ser/Thr protein kinase RdoA (MazF antagonist)